MLSPARVWLVLGVLYALFFGWYTSFGGPLTPEEIDHYLEVLADGDGEPERVAIWKHFMETDTGDDFAMLNAIEMREKPLAVDGVGAGESSSEVLRRYAEPFLRQALKRAAPPALGGGAVSASGPVTAASGALGGTGGPSSGWKSRPKLPQRVVPA